MRTEKFDNTKEEYDNDDIKYAFVSNGLSERLNDIDVIVAEVCGENDGYPWYWILQMKNGTYSWASGWCDYSGWDCQSGAEIHDGYESAENAINALDIGDDNRKKIKECLTLQVQDKLPFAIYTE
jgi:hypothetical protein